MSRASRARRIAAAAAFGGGGIGALGAAAYGVLLTEVRMTRKLIGQPFGNAGPGGEGIYGVGLGAPIQLAFIGDSTAVGLGVDHPWQTPGAVLASGLAEIAQRPVQLRIDAKVGGKSDLLDEQAARLLAGDPIPDAVVVMVGANDVTHRSPTAVAVRGLDAAVRRLREAGVEVIVGTCPDLGTIEQIPHPLRYLARRFSRELAAAQTIAVVEAGGRTVSLADLLGPEFAARPLEMFSADKFHPSATGYARAAAAMLPSVATALGYWPAERDRHPDVLRGEGIDDIAHAAVRAVDSGGTEVAGIEISGAERGPRGRWVAFFRRRTPVTVTEQAVVTAGAAAVTPPDPEV
ncbi:MAG TPA: SGNH/GDSL hydrolase family protein [Kineosporiaceae bacterium]|nr:SGNH/GDSL hydrolase family protein [Kineosporiaceae bacterium]